MYDNIGSKIKGLAKASFAIGAIGCALIGLTTMASDDDLILTGLLIVVVGYLIAWLSSWCLYGFGELIDKVCDIERNTRNNGVQFQSPVVSERIQKLKSSGLKE